MSVRPETCSRVIRDWGDIGMGIAYEARGEPHGKMVVVESGNGPLYVLNLSRVYHRRPIGGRN